jgi:hypothetical protein
MASSPRSAGVIEAKTEHYCHHSSVGVSGHFGIVTISWDGEGRGRVDDSIFNIQSRQAGIVADN